MALRTPLSVTPHLYMGDSTGRPLDMGTVYFGEPDKDPEFYPITLYSDDALTLPLAQPVHTKGGYLYDKGDMVEPHAKELIYSVKVLDSYGRKVFYKGAMMRNSWNDDVIEQINTAIISSADVARQIATDITNDAINNTAIDGGVLADTFVVVDGSLSQRTINKGLESITDLSTINNPKDGLRVYVKSYHAGLGKGGGYFTYDGSQSTVNDGGLVLNGWVRNLNDFYVTPEMFGATGNKDDDQTDALKSCFENGEYPISGSGDYQYRDNLKVYTDLNISGQLIGRPLTTATKGITLSVEEVGGKSQAYDVVSKDFLTDLDALNDEIGVPRQYIGRYIHILTDEKKVRDNPIPEYPMDYAGYVIDEAGAVKVIPRLPIELNKSLIREVRVYKQRPQLVIRIASMFMDLSDVHNHHDGSPSLIFSSDVIGINIDNTKVELGSFSHTPTTSTAHTGVMTVIGVLANNCTISDLSLVHSNGSTGGQTDSYGIRLGLCCDVDITNITGTTHGSTVAAGNSYRVNVRDSVLSSAGAHFGSDWTIDNCIVGRVTHGGADISVINSKIEFGCTNHGDYAYGRGYFIAKNCTWEGRALRFLDTSHEARVQYVKPTSLFDEVIIDGLTILNGANRHSGTKGRVLINADSYAQSRIGVDGGWDTPQTRVPQRVVIRNLDIQDDKLTDITGLSMVGHSNIFSDGGVNVLRVHIDNVTVANRITKIAPLIINAAVQAPFTSHLDSLVSDAPSEIKSGTRTEKVQYLNDNGYNINLHRIDSASDIKFKVEAVFSNIFANVSGVRDSRFIESADYINIGSLDMASGAIITDDSGGSLSDMASLPLNNRFNIVNSSVSSLSSASYFKAKSIDFSNCTFTTNIPSNTAVTVDSAIGCKWVTGISVSQAGIDAPTAYYVNSSKYSGVS